MEELEKQRLEKLFNATPKSEAEAVEIVKARLDACLQHLGDDAEFIVSVKAPHDRLMSTTVVSKMGTRVAVMHALSKEIPSFLWPTTQKRGLFSSIFKRGAK